MFTITRRRLHALTMRPWTVLLPVQIDNGLVQEVAVHLPICATSGAQLTHSADWQLLVLDYVINSLSFYRAGAARLLASAARCGLRAGLAAGCRRHRRRLPGAGLSGGEYRELIVNVHVNVWIATASGPHCSTMCAAARLWAAAPRMYNVQVPKRSSTCSCRRRTQRRTA